MTTTRHLRAITVIAAFTLPLSACSLPGIPGLGGVALTASDVITITSPDVSVAGESGESLVEISEHALISSYALPDGTVIYTVEQELSAQDRARIEESAEAYLGWEGRTPEKRREQCSDVGTDRVQVSGSISHDSTDQDCDDESPLRSLQDEVRAAQGEVVTQLALPTESWTLEITPGTGDGPDTASVAEQYEVGRGSSGEGMAITADDVPDGWGEDLGDGLPSTERPLGWERTGAVLRDLNTLLLDQDDLGCDDPTGEIRVTAHSEPSQTWTLPVCAGQESEVLAETLRGL